METSWNLQIVVFNGSLQPYYDVLLHGLGNSLLNGFITCLKYAISSSTSLGHWSLPRVDPTINCATWLTVIVAPLIIMIFCDFNSMVMRGSASTISYSFGTPEVWNGFLHWWILCYGYNISQYFEDFRIQVHRPHGKVKKRPSCEQIIESWSMAAKGWFFHRWSNSNPIPHRIWVTFSTSSFWSLPFTGTRVIPGKSIKVRSGAPVA